MLYLINLTILTNVMRSYMILRNLLELKRILPTTSTKKANELIETLNDKSNDFKMNKIVGDYHPGYFYDNIKSYKI